MGFLLLALLAFGVFGALLVLVGASQGSLAEGLALDLTGTGLLVSALSLGIGIGVAGMGPLSDRLAWRPLFVIAAATGAAALLLGAAWPGPVRLALAVGLCGVGAGAYETLLNTAVPQADPRRAASRLALVHSAATAGAVLGAVGLGALATRHGFAAAFAATGVGLAVVALAGLVAPFPERMIPGPAPSASSGPGGSSPGLVAVWPLAAASFAYVGFETALTVFAQPWARHLGLSEARGVAMISAFWLGLFAGRLLFALLRRRGPPGLLAAGGVVAALLVVAGVALELRAVEAWGGGLGVLLGVVFPLLVAFTAERYPARRGSAIAVVVGAGSLGGFAVPWLTGVLGDAVGVRAAVASLAVWCVLVALAVWPERAP